MKVETLVIFIAISLVNSLSAVPTTPVVLIPGDGGSQLLAKLAKPDVVHYFCSNYTEDYYSIWLNVELLTPYVLDCTVDNLRLQYDPVSRKTRNSPGVDIRAAQFGDTDGVEWLDPSHLSISSYYAPLVDMLVSKGYSRGVDIYGAPYDFRKAPNELKLFYANLTRIIETSYEVNKKPSLVVAHSLGNMVFTYFMSTKTQSWKDKYVAGYVALSAPLGGAAKLFRLYASGDTLGERFVSALSVRRMQRTFPSSAFLLPYSAPHFWADDYPFIITHNRTYGIKDIPVLAKDINFPDLYDMRLNTEKLVDITKMHPGVPIYCTHGHNISTPLQFKYSTDSMFPDSQPDVVHGNGDGTVNDVSLNGCELWRDSKWHFEHQLIMEQGEHVSILSSPEYLDYMAKILKL